MNRNEAERLAAAVSQVRPDWPAQSVFAMLARPDLRDRSARDVAIALMWIAHDPDSRTPARVIEAGPWWMQVTATDRSQSGHQPPTRDQECATHPGGWADHCAGCRADRLAAH